MVPEAIVRTYLEEEFQTALHWAKRKAGLQIELLPATFQIRVSLIQPGTNEEFFLLGTFDDYRAVPPKWEFCDKDWRPSNEKSKFPKPGPSSIFHGQPTICAPFNRLAYSEHKGPHGDWGGPTSWQSAGRGHVQAHSIGEMIQCIWRDFSNTRGRMQ